VNWIVRRAVGTGLVVTLGAGIALLFTAGNRGTVLDIYLLVIGGITLLALVRFARVLRLGSPVSSFETALARARAPRGGNDEALGLEREVELSRMDGFHFHVRLRPVLRDIAAHRLRVRYGVELDREPERARELLPAEVWEVVRADRPPPVERLAPGPTLSQQRRLLDGLEKL
jgi:hypothetical protein